jgi:hypothetical protein
MSPSQERSQRSHHVLEAESVVCPRRSAQKGLNLGQLELSQWSGAMIKPQELQEPPKPLTMVSYRLFSQPTSGAQI